MKLKVLASVVGAALATSTLSLVSLSPVEAASALVVTTLDDSGAGSLRDRISEANGNPDNTTITFQPGLTGTIAVGDSLDITSNTRIDGDDRVTLQDSTVATFAVSGGAHFSLENLQIRSASSNNSPGSSAVYVDGGGNITIDGVDFANSASRSVYVDGSGDVTIANSSFENGSHNDIYVKLATGDVAVSNSSFVGTPEPYAIFIASGASAVISDVDVDGAGILFSQYSNNVAIERTMVHSGALGMTFTLVGGDVLISNSTVSGTTGSYFGGTHGYAISGQAVSGSFEMVNSTVADNDGEALVLIDTDADIRHSTISGNAGVSAVLALLDPGPVTATFDHAIVSGNDSADVAVGQYVGAPGIDRLDVEAHYSVFSADPIEGANLIGTYSKGTGVVTETDAGLGSLVDNGGPTPTMKPQGGSPAANSGDPSAIAGFNGVPEFDQRGAARVQNDRIDIGAVEGATSIVSIVGSASVEEVAGSITIEVTRSGAVDTPAAVEIATAVDTAGVQDFTPTAELLEWDAGDASSRQFTVPILPDTEIEGSESFSIVLSNPMASGIANGMHTVEIVDVPPLSISTEQISVEEAAGAVEIVVDRPTPATTAASVEIATASDTATSGTDFEAASGTLAWAAGEAGSKTFAVPILADVLVEGDETFRVVLSNAVGTTITDTQAMVTILDTPVEAIVPVDPARYLDTRDEPTFDGESSGDGRPADGGVIRVQIAGRGDVPADAVGVVGNLTAIGPSDLGFATMYPCTAEVPTASNVNFAAGDVVANNSTVPLNVDGEVCIFTRTSSDFALDVNGFVPAGSPVTGIEPARYLDTRDSPTFDELSSGGGRLPVDGVVEVQIAGRGDVPSDAVAAIVNVTVIAPDGPGFATAYPCGARPAASSLNYGAGAVVPNGAVAQLSERGTLCVFSKSPTDLAIDVSGYVPADTSGLVTNAPVRLLDTRPGEQIVDGDALGAGTVASGGFVEVQVAGRADVPAGATAAILNVAVIAPDGPGFVTLYPCGERPTASNLNHSTAGVVRANNAITKLSDSGSVCVFTRSAANLILDIAGYLTAP